MEKFYTVSTINYEGTLETVKYLLSIKEDLIKDYKSRCKNVYHPFKRRCRNENDLWSQLDEWCESGETWMSERLKTFLCDILNRYFLTYKDELFNEAGLLSLKGRYVNCSCIEHDGHVCGKFVRNFEEVTKICMGNIIVNDSVPVLMLIHCDTIDGGYEYVEISWRISDSVGNIRPIIKGNFRTLKLALLDGTIDLDKYPVTRTAR